MPSAQDKVVVGELVSASSIADVLIMPFGMPSLEAALRAAYAKSAFKACAIGLADVKVVSAQRAFLVGTVGIKISGKVLYDRGIAGCAGVSEDAIKEALASRALAAKEKKLATKLKEQGLTTTSKSVTMQRWDADAKSYVDVKRGGKLASSPFISSATIDKGYVIVQTSDVKDPKGSLYVAIMKTLLMHKNPTRYDLYKTRNIKYPTRYITNPRAYRRFRKMLAPYLAGRVRDNTGRVVFYPWRANRYTRYLMRHRMKSGINKAGKRILYVSIPMVK